MKWYLHPSILAWQIKAFIRRTRDYRLYQEYLIAGSLKISYFEQVVFKEEKRIALTYKEHQVLLYFAKHQGEIISLCELCEEVWHKHYYKSDSYTIMTCIRHLRDKIGEDLIITIYGQGYVLKV